MLAHVRVDDGWLPEADAERVFTARRELPERASGLAHELVAATAAVRDRARDELLELARRARVPELADWTRDTHAAAAAAWRRNAQVVLEVRAERSTLVALDERTTSLGTGAPVRLQLPTLRTISIGTTVGVPLR
jgi:hypothetical protein